MTALRVAGLVSILALSAFAAGDIVENVRVAAAAHNYALADREIQAYRASAGVTPEMLEALSWQARATFDDRQYDRADGYALEIRKLAAGMRRGHPSPEVALDVALGAAIEVHAQVLAARGERPEALAFLRQELTANHDTPIAGRIQKNINLLTLEGKPAPALDVSHWLAGKPQPLAALRGHPVLLFFWAHWCVDCKAEAPTLARLMQVYGSKGLLLVAPTQLYGYAAEGADVTPEQETKYIDLVRTNYYAALGNVPVPLSAQNFQRYGCSTTPTLVLLDKLGIVRLYHPGAMNYQALDEKIRKVFAPGASAAYPTRRHIVGKTG